tara:strand:+ start:679 stop:1017 length:339 start_codon:yes stop_codon:yes gene_type:complete
MTQHEDRIAKRQAREQAKAAHKGWNKHTINLRKGSGLDLKFQESMNKSEMVRRVFAKVSELHLRLNREIDENAILKDSIAKLQARLAGTRTDEDAFREAASDPAQTKFEVEE